MLYRRSASPCVETARCENSRYRQRTSSSSNASSSAGRLLATMWLLSISW
jgi:hypothetical protein